MNFFNNPHLENDEYYAALEKEIEDAWKELFSKGFPIKKSSNDFSYLDEIDQINGFELTPDPWFNSPPRPKVKQPKCECGLGTNEPSRRHYEWCCLYIKNK